MPTEPPTPMSDLDRARAHVNTPDDCAELPIASAEWFEKHRIGRQPGTKLKKPSAG
jgi:hypothetical protein